MTQTYKQFLRHSAKRRERIAAYSANGMPPSEIARRMKISHQRVAVILREMAEKAAARKVYVCTYNGGMI